MARARDGDGIQTALQTLEQEIIFGKMLPRQRLVEEEIIERFATTRHRARRVLDELVQMGLVQHIPRKGAVVRDFSLDEVRELYAMRELLQGAAIAAMALPFGQDALDTLETINHEHIRAGEDRNLLGLFEANNRFHSRFFEETGNRMLCAAIEDYARRAHPIRSLGFVDDGYRAMAQADHTDLIDAARRGDREALADIDRRHIRRPYERYMTAKDMAARFAG